MLPLPRLAKYKIKFCHLKYRVPYFFVLEKYHKEIDNLNFA